MDVLLAKCRNAIINEQNLSTVVLYVIFFISLVCVWCNAVCKCESIYLIVGILVDLGKLEEYSVRQKKHILQKYAMTPQKHVCSIYKSRRCATATLNETAKLNSSLLVLVAAVTAIQKERNAALGTHFSPKTWRLCSLLKISSGTLRHG